jgi:multicomponent Na+:H+ antiporter subunit F
MVSELVLAMLALGAILAFTRLMRGPTLPDRVIAIDLIGVLIVCTLVVVASSNALAVFLDVAIFIALISFVGTVAYARYVERGR